MTVLLGFLWWLVGALSAAATFAWIHHRLNVEIPSPPPMPLLTVGHLAASMALGVFGPIGTAAGIAAALIEMANDRGLWSRTVIPARKRKGDA